MKRFWIVFLSLCLIGCVAIAEDDGVVDSGGSYDFDTNTYSSYWQYENGDITYKEENDNGVKTSMYDAQEDSWHTVYEDADGNMTVIDEKNGQGSVAYYPTEGYEPDENETIYRDEYGTYTPAHPTYNNAPYNNPTYAPTYSGSNITAASGTAWVQTSGGRLNVRAYPSKDADVLRKIDNGTQVTVTGYSGEWTRIHFGGTRGYVMSRYLRYGHAPAPAPTPYPAPEKTATEQYGTMTWFSPRTVTVHPSRVGGFVNLRWAPSKKEPVIRYCYEGYTLTAIAGNSEWIQVMDPLTNQVGFMMRAFVSGI